MIQVVMLDLGMTLLDSNNRPFPGVREALEKLATLPVKSCLVSDFLMNLSASQAMVQYVAILEAAGLKDLFEPALQRITLSNHAGVSKPDRMIFLKALERLNASAVSLSDCLFVTENVAHIEAVRANFQMATLQFGLDFTDWSQFSGKLQTMLSDKSHWVPISVPGHADLTNILVQVPSTNVEDIAEVQLFVASLAENNKIGGRPGFPASHPTHALELDALGHRQLVRKGFTAVNQYK